MKAAVLILVYCAACLAGCAGLTGPTDPDKVYFPGRGESEDIRALAQKPEYARLALYAALSESAYSFDLKTRTWTGGVSTSLEDFCQQNNTRFKPDWLEELDPALYVLPEAPDFGWNVGGLGYTISAETLPSGRKRVFLVFRGTDAEQWGDWFSNFRWVTRLLFFVHDEYDQLKRILPKIMERIRSVYGQDALVEVTGHSLGGGLAQFAAYDAPGAPAPEIKTVYAFDPSPVTGFYSAPAERRRTNVQGLNTYRIYDHGEVLAYLRLLTKLVYPVSKENPRITPLRFNLLKGHIISQHGMRPFTCALWNAMGRPELKPGP